MPCLCHIIDPPYLYEILHTGRLIQRITRTDFDSPRELELSFDDLSEELQAKVVKKVNEESEDE